jgi:GrpB protein
VVEGSLSLRNQIAVRGVLRADADLRDQHAAAKRRVGAAAANLEEYGRGKNAMVQKILGVAGLIEAERAPSTPIASHRTMRCKGRCQRARLPDLCRDDGR